MNVTVIMKEKKYGDSVEFKTINATQIRNLVDIALDYGKYLEIIPENIEKLDLSRGEKFLEDLEKIDRGEM